MSDDIEKLLAELFIFIARHEKDIAHLQVIQASVVSQVYETLRKCHGYECDTAATHSCGGQTKRYLCERHLAEQLIVFKTKDGREVARKLWKELPNIVVIRALHDYKTLYENIVPKFMQ